MNFKNTNKNIFKILASGYLIFFIFLASSTIALAADPTPTPSPTASPTAAAQNNDIILQVPILEYTRAQNIVEYIAKIYQAALYILVPATIVVIIISGIQWILAGGDSGKIKAAKARIVNAFLGLFIGLLSYTVLSLIGLGNLNLSDITYIENIPLEDGISAADDAFPSSQQPGNVKSQGQDCFLNTYGGSSGAVQANLVSISFGGKKLRVHKLAQSAFLAASQKITSAGLTAKQSVGTFNWRPNRNNPSKLSPHSFGIAIDIEWQNNGNCHPKGADNKKYQELKAQFASNLGEICKRAKEFHCTCSHDPRLISAMTSSGFRWGAYKNTFDSMHFEWTGKCFGK